MFLACNDDVLSTLLSVESRCHESSQYDDWHCLLFKLFFPYQWQHQIYGFGASDLLLLLVYIVTTWRLWCLPPACTDFLLPICSGELDEQSEQHLGFPRHWLPIWLLSVIGGVDSDYRSSVQPAFHLARQFFLLCLTLAAENNYLVFSVSWLREGYKHGTSPLGHDHCWACLVFWRP